MFNVLTGLAMGIVIFAITIGVGTVVLQKFGDSVSDCSTRLVDGVNNATTSPPTCSNASGSTTVSTATTTTSSLNGELGTSGLAGWTGAIIALAVGLLFIGALMGKRSN